MTGRVSRFGFAVLCLGLCAAGCKADGETRSPEDGTTSAADGQHRRGDRKAAKAVGEPVVFASVGVPHGAAISQISLAPDGAAALSRDTLGGVRMWPALDGSREPLVVPIRDPRGMSLAAREAGGWTLALRDASGGARVVGVDASGEMRPLASLPPTDPIAELMVMPGGDRLLAVGGDHVLRLLDREGEELARLDTKGVRFASLRLAMEAEGGPRVLALTAGEFDGKQGRFAVEVVPLEIGESSLDLAKVGAKGRQTIFLDSPSTHDNPTLAPDGRALVYLQRQRMGGATWRVVATQLADGAQVSVDSEIGVGVQPRLGLMEAGRVLLDDGTGLGRVVDLRERHVELTPIRSAPTVDHLAGTTVAGVRAVPAGNWLGVHDLASNEISYLGYEQISVTDAGLSPRGDLVAWALGDRVAVERIDGSHEVLQVPGTRPLGQRYVEFLDDDTLVTVDWAGGAKLLRWTDGEVLDAVDLGNNVQNADLARDSRGEGVLLVRTNLWQNPTLLALREASFGHRYISPATTLAGLLAPRASATIDDWGMWTLDGTAKLRELTLADLEGLDTKTALEGGEVLSAGMPQQFVIGADATRYRVTSDGARTTLFAERGSESEQAKLATGFVVMLSPSRDGRRIAVVQQRDPGQVVTVLDTATLQPLWAQPIPAVQGLTWSDAGESLAVPAMLGGGVVLDGASGKPRTARCGLGFEVKHTPPAVQGFFNQLSVCEL
jgi:hypothetical protein